MRKALGALTGLAFFVLVPAVAYAAAPEDLPLRVATWVLTLLRNLGAIVVVLRFILNGYKLAISQDPRAHADAYSGIVKTAVGALLVFGAHLLAEWLQNAVLAM